MLALLAFAFVAMPFDRHASTCSCRDPDAVPDPLARGHRPEYPGGLLRPDLAGHRRPSWRWAPTRPITSSCACRTLNFIVVLPARRAASRRWWACSSAFRACASRASTSRSRRSPRSSSSTGCSRASSGSPTIRSSGSVSTPPIEIFGWIDRLAGREVPVRAGDRRSCSTLVAKNLVRGHIGRSWMAMRDMDVAAEVIGIRPLYAKLSAFAVSSFYCRRGGRAVGVRPPRRVGAARVQREPARSTCCS